MAKRAEKFARLSLDYADHPKIAGLSDAAFRAHVEMILYSRKYLTDGVIAKQIAKRLLPHVLDELLSNDDEAPSLVALDNGDYLLHGFCDMQETKAEVEAKRLVRAAAGRKGGLAKKQNAKQNAKQSAKQSAKQTPSKSGSKNVAEKEKEKEKEINNHVGDSASGSADLRLITAEVVENSEAAGVREDVEALLGELESLIEANGNRAPKRNKQARDAMRLLLDRDGYTQEQVSFIIRWSQASNFWQANILSAAKLREKFGQLVAQARRDSRRKPTRAEETAWAVSPENTFVPAWARS